MANPISPKVTASGLTGLITTLLLAVVTLITPDMFTGLGKWSSLAYGLVIALASAVAGWLKTDPLRTGTIPPVVIPTTGNLSGVVADPDTTPTV